MVYCPECGSEVTPEDIFCGNCGITLTPFVPIGEDVKNAPISEDEARDDAAADSQNLTAQSAGENPPIEFSEDAKSFTSTKDQLQNKASEEIEADENFASSAPLSFDANPLDLEEVDSLVNENIVERKSDEWSMAADAPEFSSSPNDTEKRAELEDVASDKLETKKSPEDSAEIKEIPISFSDSLNEPKTVAASDESWSEFPSPQPSFSTDITPQSFEPPVPQNFDKSSEENNSEAKNQKSAEENISPINEEKVVKESDGQVVDQDFQATMPYTPTDFSQQNLVAAKIANENPLEKKPLEEPEPVKLSPSDAEKFAVSENSAPIVPPNSPVGSSPHGSLEPTSISVQIYDPKQRPEDVEPPTLLSSPEEVKAMVEQAKAEPPRESRSYTSQNMTGGDTDGKGKAKLKPLDEGTILNNRYEVVRKIGGGGMGAVYLASDKNLGGISRAVKEMVQSYIEDSQQEKAVNDFRRESMLLTSLEHPSIPTIFDYFFDETEARFYLVMKYISGGDLAARLRASSEGKIDEAMVTEWAIQLADVLDYLHNRQPPIVYRDLKPSNIMIDGNTGKVMLIDFGIARWVNKEEKGVTAVGTMGYAPPELFSGNVEPRSDIYSLGSTMFHLLTGADPQSNPLLIFDFNKHPRPRQINSRLTDQMEQILMKMVEYTAAKRFTSADELKEVLISHLDNLKKGRVTTGVADSQSSASNANLPVFCGFCGQKILAADVFCPFCGAQQATAAGQGAPAAQPRATARLVIVGTNELDSPIFKLEKDDNLVGRRDPMSNIFPEVDLSKFDPQTKISRRHARIWRDRDSFLVEDLGSSNGTILISKINESQKLGRNQPRTLTNGDKIRVGDTTLHFVFD